ncbi:MAG: GGDEF domain-containing protein, partial [Gloeomargarita sp. HHBFW_bins_162]
QELLTEIRQSTLHNSRLFARCLIVILLLGILGLTWIHLRVESLPFYGVLVGLDLLMVGISLAFLFISRPGSGQGLAFRWGMHRRYCIVITFLFNIFFALQWYRLGHNSTFFIMLVIYTVLWSYPDRWGLWFYPLNFVYYIGVISSGNTVALTRFSGYFAGFSMLFLTWVCEQIIFDLRLRDFQLRQTVLAQAQELQQVNQELHQMAFRDGLTGLANRRGLDDFLATAWKTGIAAQTPLALLLCDVDHFKRYNDGYGHTAGDQCLREIAQIFRTTFPQTNLCLARYGGEEFAVVLPATTSEAAQAMAQRLLDNVRSTEIPHAYTLTGNHVSMSIGISSTIPHPDLSPNALILSADLALYTAKSQGRNQAVYQALSCPSSQPTVE